MNYADEIMRQSGMSAQDKNSQYSAPMTSQQKRVSTLAKGQASRDANMNTEDWKAEEQEMESLGYQDAASNAASQIRKTEPTYKAPTPTPTKVQAPKQEIMTQVQAVAESNPQVDEVFGMIDDAVKQEIEEDVANGNLDEHGLPQVPKTKERFKKEFPWDVLLTAISGAGAMMGLTPFMNFTDMGFEVSNNRAVRKAFAEGQANVMNKVGEGETIQNEQDAINTRTEQIGNENLAENKANLTIKDKEFQNLLDLADKEYEASLNELGLKLKSDKELALLDSDTKKELQRLTNQCQKELAKLGYEHSENMPKLMAGGAYSAYEDAVAKGYDKSFTEWMRNNEGRALWQDITGAAIKSIEAAGSFMPGAGGSK